MAPPDAWAMVQDESVAEKPIRLLQPPFRFPQARFVTEESVRTAIEKHGFVPGPADAFRTWREVFDFLRSEQSKHQVAEPDWNQEVDAPELLALTPLDILVDYVDHIESDWIPEGKFDPAFRLLSDLIKLRKVQADGALFERVLTLRDRVRRPSKPVVTVPSIGRPEVTGYREAIAKSGGLLIAA